MRNLRTDPHIIERQLDQDTAENYSSQLDGENIKLAQALYNAAEFNLPWLRSEADKFLKLRDSIPFALFGVLLWSIALWRWTSLEMLGTAMFVVALLVIPLSRRKTRMRELLDLFEKPFLDLGDTLKRK
jgi:Flp pilus assembly protein TadB